MALRKRESSAETAARFLASHDRKASPYRAPRLQRDRLQRDRSRAAAPAPAPAPAPPSVPRRIAVDFAEPTLRAIHDALLDAIHDGDLHGNRMHLTLIAREMVAVALGEPPCDDPPLTDREAG